MLAEILIVAAMGYLLITFVSPICEAIFDWIVCHPRWDKKGQRHPRWLTFHDNHPVLTTAVVTTLQVGLGLTCLYAIAIFWGLLHVLR